MPRAGKVSRHWTSAPRSVQVKATIKPTARSHGNYWLLNREARHLRAASHVYVFISIRRDGSQFYVVPSAQIENCRQSDIAVDVSMQINQRQTRVDHR